MPTSPVTAPSRARCGHTLTRLAVAAGLALASLPAVPAAAGGQGPAVPHRAWRTITTPHFRVHYPAEFDGWARDVGGRLEGIRTAVGAMVGYTPPQVIDVIIEDPVNQPNGSAWPELVGPSMRFWPTPPSPGGLGHYRNWGELLAVHEYAHLAHLLRPSRNPRQDGLMKLSPVQIGPLPLKTPAWVFEGYATVIEGRLTGSGRPNGAYRPSLLRQLALDGAMPAYGQLDATGPFLGGSMRYLVGSAFLEWLAERDGWDTHPQLWRRLSARIDRDFNAAFTGLYGDSPRVLYGRFTADVTARAVEARRRLEAAGLARGTLVQKLDWYTGAPSISPDGKRVALRRAVPGEPTTVYVWSEGAKAPDAKTQQKLDEAKRLDPEDVPDRRAYPAPRQRLAALLPRNGVGFDNPRFLADGERILVTRNQVQVDGTVVPDLWIWHHTSGWTKRITHGAAIRLADPLPSGAQAAGVRCVGSVCDLVLVDLVTGGFKVLAKGSLDAPFSGVRVSPDGRRVASARREGGRWRLVTVDIASGAVTAFGPDDAASRFEPSWLPDGTGVVAVSEAEGAPQLEIVTLDGTTQPLVRTTGMASAPEVARDGRTWFLDLHARGWDLRTITRDEAALPAAQPVLAADLAPVAPKVRTDDAREFPSAGTSPGTYGLGPQRLGWFPFGGVAIEGAYGGAAVTLSDPVGRFSAEVQAGLGRGGTWRGTSGGVAWRGWRPAITLEGWAARHDPSRQREVPPGEAFDVDYQGGALLADLPIESSAWSLRMRGGVSAGVVDARVPFFAGFDNGGRSLGALRLEANGRFTPRGQVRITPTLAIDGSVGSTAGTSWQRGVAEASLGVAPWKDEGLRAVAMAGVTSSDAPTYERFVFGGAPSPYVDALFLGQRLAMPALPFGVAGGRAASRLRLEGTGLLRPFYEWYTAGDDLSGDWRRVTGVEVDVAAPSVPPLRVPATKVRLGVAWAVDAPRRERPTAYLSFVLAP